MNGRLSKVLRRTVYGSGGTGRFREWISESLPERTQYRLIDRLNRSRVIGTVLRTWWRGTVRADARRHRYQKLKRLRGGLSWRQVQVLKSY